MWLRFSSLEFIVRSDYRDQGKTKAEVWGHQDVKSSGFRFGSEDRKWTAKDEVDEIFVLSNLIQVESFYTTLKAI